MRFKQTDISLAGGLHDALKCAAPDARVIAAFDWDPLAIAVYEANHGSGIARRKDISQLTADEIEVFDADIWLASPACQPYTVLGLQKGVDDPRARSFLHLINEVLVTLATRNKHPEYIIVENVAGFETLGYQVSEFLLSPKQYGIPNARLRYYLAARKAEGVSGSSSRVLTTIPGDLGAVESEGIKKIADYLDPLPDQSTLVPERILVRWGKDDVGYTHLIEGSGSILQINEEMDTTEAFNEFAARQEAGDDDAVSTLHKLVLRYFSPEELLRLFYLSRPTRPFVWPQNTSRKSKYRLIGNSVNVEVSSHRDSLRGQFYGHCSRLFCIEISFTTGPSFDYCGCGQSLTKSKLSEGSTSSELPGHAADEADHDQNNG
ncbi:7077_t:CDS:2 [Acaulospora colombiana]|uniref:7077_t:CDS:1 n=1 Tax=Acaulospora colombiana TaxID=27376 RepID=A0ACA9LY29_9GLOM|nr:7077_t:CDS:2 [Acaulospora colombiana]